MDKYKITYAKFVAVPNGMQVHWNADDIGFGIITMVSNDFGDVVIDSENMSREFVVAVIAFAAQWTEMKLI